MGYRFRLNRVEIKNRVLYEDTEIIIPKNGISVILGANGCGKTTLLNQILFQNLGNVILIAQENDLIFTDLSVKENIMLLHKNESKLLELLKRLNIEYILDRDPRYLSGGEKRIVSILRMFFCESEVVLLDEPTNDLDYKTVEVVKNIILNLSGEKSILIVTHDERISSVSKLSYVFENGKIAADKLDVKEGVFLKKKEDNKKKPLPVKRDVVSNFIFLLSMMVIIFIAFALFFARADEVEYIKDGQTNVASKFYANINAMIKNGYVPIEAYKAYNGDVDMDFLETYSAALTDAQNSGGSLNMFLDKEIGEHVYVCAFVDMKTNDHIYLLKEYQSLREHQTGVVPNFYDYITIFDGINEIAEKSEAGVTEKIDDVLYFEMEKVCEEAYEFQPTIYVILGAEESKLKLVEGNVFIKNNKTVDICNDINNFVAVLDSIKVLAFGVLAGLLIHLIYFTLAVRQLKKYIIVFRNLGVPRAWVKKVLFDRMCSPITKIIISSLCGGVCVSLSLIAKKHLMFAITIAVISFVVGILHILISKRILCKVIENTYSFGGIYED